MKMVAKNIWNTPGNWSIPVLITLVACIASVNFPSLYNYTYTSSLFFFAFPLSVVFAVLIFNFRSVAIIEFSSIDLSIIIFFGWLFLNSSATKDYFQLHVAELVVLLLWYAILRIVKPDAQLLFGALIIGAGFQAIYGLLQYHGEILSNSLEFDITGSFNNPGPYAGYLCCSVPVILTGILCQCDIRSLQRPWVIALLGVLLTLIALALFRAESRAAWIATGCICLIILVRWNEPKLFGKIHISKWLKGLLIITSIVMLILAAPMLYHIKKGSADGRLLIWQVSLSMFRDHPWRGDGFDNFKTQYMAHQASYLETHRVSNNELITEDVNNAFCEPLQFIIENGVIGSVIFILLCRQLWRSKAKPAWISVAAGSGIAAIGIFSLFSYPLHVLPIKVYLVMFIALLANAECDINYTLSFRPGKAIKIAFIIPAILAIGVYDIWLRTSFYNLQQWNIATAAFDNQEYVASTHICRDIYPQMRSDGEFLFDMGRALNRAGSLIHAASVYNEAVTSLNTSGLQMEMGDNYIALKDTLHAVQAYQTAASMVPGKLYPLYKLALLYDASTQKEKALAIARTIVAKKVKFKNDEYKMIFDEMNDLLQKNGNIR